MFLVAVGRRLCDGYPAAVSFTVCIHFASYKDPQTITALYLEKMSENAMKSERTCKFRHMFFVIDVKLWVNLVQLY